MVTCEELKGREKSRKVLEWRKEEWEMVTSPGKEWRLRIEASLEKEEAGE